MPSLNPRQALALTLAAAIAVPAEGIRRVAYYDPPGILTVCRGHTGPDVAKGKKYSLTECDGFLNADMLKAIAIVERCVPGLPSHVLAAFADAVFNMGGTIVCDKPHSTAARKLAAGDIEGACMELPKWNNTRIGGVLMPLPGLTSRRALERDLCLTGEMQ